MEEYRNGKHIEEYRVESSKSNKSSFEKLTVFLGFLMSLATFFISVMAFWAGYHYFTDRLETVKKEAEYLLNRIKDDKKESSKHVDMLSKSVQRKTLEGNFSEIMSIGLTGEYVDRATVVAKDKASNDVRRADALLELYKQNYKSALFLWEKILEYERQAVDAIYYCSLLQLIFTMEDRDIEHLLKSKKYLKNIPEDAVESIFEFLDYTYTAIDDFSFGKNDRDKFYSYIEFVYSEIEKTKKSFELYFRWGFFLKELYEKAQIKNPKLLHRSLKMFSNAEQFIQNDSAISQRTKVVFYMRYADVMSIFAEIDRNNAATYWDKVFHLLEPIKDAEPMAKYHYALKLWEKNQFYNKYSKDDLKEVIVILEELQTTNVKSNVMRVLRDIYVNMYKNYSYDIDLLVKASEYINFDSLSNEQNVFEFYNIFYILYNIASISNNKEKYIKQAKDMFKLVEAYKYTDPEIFEYRIRFMILAGASDQEIISAFSRYHGAIPQDILREEDFKKYIDEVFAIRYHKEGERIILN